MVMAEKETFSTAKHDNKLKRVCEKRAVTHVTKGTHIRHILSHDISVE